MSTVEGKCRCCLQKDGNLTESTFNAETNADELHIQKVKDLFEDIKLPEDSKPFLLCETCLQMLSIANSFKETIINTYTGVELSEPFSNRFCKGCFKNNATLSFKIVDIKKKVEHYHMPTFKYCFGFLDLNIFNHVCMRSFFLCSSCLDKLTITTHVKQSITANTQMYEPRDVAIIKNDNDFEIDEFIKEESFFTQDAIPRDENYDNESFRNIRGEDYDVNSMLTSNDNEGSAEIDPLSSQAVDLQYTDIHNFQCKHCDREFISKAFLKEHEKEHGQSGQYSCRFCKKLFLVQEYLTCHEKIHVMSGDLAKEHKCRFCSETFANGEYLQYHTLINHSEEIKDEVGVKVIVKQVPRIYSCSYKECERTFSLKRDLATHEKVHEDRPHQCVYCSKMFEDADSLKLHEQLHNEERPFKCPHCVAAFRVKDTLISHLSIHISEQRPFNCQYCTWTFSDRRSLLDHEKLHTGDTPYMCRFCSQSFRLDTYRIMHMKVKHGDFLERK